MDTELDVVSMHHLKHENFIVAAISSGHGWFTIVAAYFKYSVRVVILLGILNNIQGAVKGLIMVRMNFNIKFRLWYNGKDSKDEELIEDLFSKRYLRCPDRIPK